jgi:hypothetical protein
LLEPRSLCRDGNQGQILSFACICQREDHHHEYSF